VSSLSNIENDDGPELQAKNKDSDFDSKE
jgi:hypothetical protein